MSLVPAINPIMAVDAGMHPRCLRPRPGSPSSCATEDWVEAATESDHLKARRSV